MRITEYDAADPLSALHLAMLARDLPFTPEYAARVRRADSRPFPFLALCAVEGEVVVGQVDVYRLPMMSRAGPEDVGGIWALTSHPDYDHQRLTARLLEAAHHRMREAGLRFAVFNTNRLRAEYEVFRQNGYVDMRLWATALARWETAHLPTRLQARPAGAHGYLMVDQVMDKVAPTYLGFARRPSPFPHLRATVKLDDIWIVWQNQQPIGYALAQMNKPVLRIHDLVLPLETDLAEAVAALAAVERAAYVQLTFTRRTATARLRGAGWQIAFPDQRAFMVAPLVPEVTVCDARRHFGIGSDRFLISWLDVT